MLSELPNSTTQTPALAGPKLVAIAVTTGGRKNVSSSIILYSKFYYYSRKGSPSGHLQQQVNKLKLALTMTNGILAGTRCTKERGPVEAMMCYDVLFLFQNKGIELPSN